MFVTLKKTDPDSDSNENIPDSMHGILLYYQNPSTIQIHKVSQPPSMMLRRDLEAYSKLYKLPTVTFISIPNVTSENVPRVFEGLLKFKKTDTGKDEYKFIHGDSVFVIHISVAFKANNEKLLSFNGTDKTLAAMVSKDNSETVYFPEHRIMKYLKLTSSRAIAVSWIYYLNTRLSPSTQALVSYLKEMDDTNGFVDFSIDEDEDKDSLFKQSERDFDVVWIYWSLSKPSNLGSFIEMLWESGEIDAKIHHEIFSENHPYLSSFYRAALGNVAGEEERSFKLSWKIRGSLHTYDCEPMWGAGSSETVCPDGSGLMKFCLQNKFRPPLDDAALSFFSEVDLRAYILPPNVRNDRLPTECFFDPESGDDDWTNWIIGKRFALSENQKKCVQNDCFLTFMKCKPVTFNDADDAED